MASSHRSEILTGALVLVVAIGFLIYGAGVVGTGSSTDRVTYGASFRSAEGIGLGTDVRLAGVKVGAVTGMELNPTTFRAETTIAVDPAIELPDDTLVVIASEGLLGGSFVELVPGGSPFNVEPGQEIMNTESGVSLTTLLMRFAAGGGEGQ